MDWTTLVPVIVGGVLAVAGGAVVEVVKSTREPRRRRHERSEDAALHVQDRLTRLFLDLNAVKFKIDNPDSDSGYDLYAFLEENYDALQQPLLQDAGLITDRQVRQTVRFVARAIAWSWQIASNVKKVEGHDAEDVRVAINLTEHGLDVVGAYLRGDEWKEPDEISRYRRYYNAFQSQHNLPIEL